MYKVFWLFSTVAMIIIGCTPTDPRPIDSPLVPTDLPVLVSPLGQSSPLESSSSIDAVPFRINRPVRVGDTILTGSGPAGIQIVIVNATTMGDRIGSGVIGPDGQFSIVVLPLEANIRIGLEIGDLSGTGHLFEDFNGDVYKGEEALLLPMVGYFHDTVFVQSE